MSFSLPHTEIFVPDGLPAQQALARTTHLAIAAHQDDLEIMAAAPILECFQKADKWFTGIIVTNGKGAPRNRFTEALSDDAYQQLRNKEQKKAAVIGEYAALVLLDYPSEMVRDNVSPQITDVLRQFLLTANPDVVYTHNLADRHETHVAVTLKTITAIRSLPPENHPTHLYGCEVWGDLDWLVHQHKVTFDLSAHEDLQAALLGVFDTQIRGGKRYDLAALGRRRAHATFSASHQIDTHTATSFAMDLTPLIRDTDLTITSYIQNHIAQFAAEVNERLERLSEKNKTG
jgi:LmbE family N-acetylglucosaminyl deacetylase